MSMNKAEALDRLLEVFRRYYTVNRETPPDPFDAEAVFHLHNENYILIKSAKYAEQDSNEYVYFVLVDSLTPELYRKYETSAWEDCLSRAAVRANHRNSDASLYILADRIEPETLRLIKKARLSKSYKFGFHGYSHYRVIALDLPAMRYTHNYMGELLARTVKIVFPEALSQRRC